VAVGCKAGILALVNFLVSKEVCYEYPDRKRLATVRGWEIREKIAIVIGALYLLGTSLYVAVFLFMVPEYAANTYLQATLMSVAVIEILKPFLQSVLLTLVLKSKYGNSFAAHFPQLSDFSHRYVLEDAEFTHAHWAELTRVLNSSTDTKEKVGSSSGDEDIGMVRPTEGLARDEGLQSGSGPDADPPDSIAKDGSLAMDGVTFEGKEVRLASEAKDQSRGGPFRCGADLFACCVVQPDAEAKKSSSSQASSRYLF
jgi:hypothetical protein